MRSGKVSDLSIAVILHSPIFNHLTKGLSMMRRPMILSALALSAVGCAVPGHTTKLAPETASQLKATYSCVRDAIASRGYSLSAYDTGFLVSGKIREDMPDATATHSVAEARSIVSVGLSEPTKTGGGYTLDLISARVGVDPSTHQVVVDANASTGVGATAQSGYTPRAASGTGKMTVYEARACAGSARASME
jgi:hypothetical protein